MEATLKCLQIVMSCTITDKDIERLENYSEMLLSDILNKFKIKLTPKLHLFTHYPNAIRKVGPLKHMWMMRFECKHMFFTDAAKRTLNFTNISKSLAVKHQSQLVAKGFSIESNFEESKKITLFVNHKDFSKYDSILNLTETFRLENLHALPFFNYNNYIYRNGLLLIDIFLVHEIIFILKSSNDYYFLCEFYETKKIETSLNSIEIEKNYVNPKHVLLKHNEICNSQSFEKRSCDGKIYSIAENLCFYNFNE